MLSGGSVMLKHWLFLCGILAALNAFAEENLDSLISLRDSTYGRDSTVMRVNLEAGLKTLSRSHQISLTDWLQSMSETTQPRIVVDGIFHNTVIQSSDRSDAVLVPWEKSVILFLNGVGSDSFLVRASHTGCPGTEVGASIAVSFATPSGWSYPPVRFGPLNDHSLCALGQGFQMEIFAGNEGPFVRISRDGVHWGARR
jgi:hypothetical protein